MASAATLTATTLEGQAREVARLMLAAELAIPAETRPDNVQIATDFENRTVNITISLPVTLSGSGAAFTFTASEYLD